MGYAEHIVFFTFQFMVVAYFPLLETLLVGFIPLSLNYFLLVLLCKRVSILIDFYFSYYTEWFFFLFLYFCLIFCLFLHMILSTPCG